MITNRPSTSVAAPVRASGMATLTPTSGCLPASRTRPEILPVVPANAGAETNDSSSPMAAAAVFTRGFALLRRQIDTSALAGRRGRAGRIPPPRSTRFRLLQNHHLARARGPRLARGRIDGLQTIQVESIS